LGVSLLDPKSTHFGSYWDPVWTPFGGVCLTLDGGDHQDPRPTDPRGRSLGIPVCVLLRAAALALAGTTPFGGVHLTPNLDPRPWIWTSGPQIWRSGMSSYRCFSKWMRSLDPEIPGTPGSGDP